MNPWWKMALVLTWTLFVAGVMHTIDAWHAGYVASKQEAGQITAMGLADDVFLSGQQKIIDFNQQWSIDREKDTHPCLLLPSARRLLK